MGWYSVLYKTAPTTPGLLSVCLVFEGADVVFLDTTQVVVPPTSKNVREKVKYLCFTKHITII